MCQPTKRSFEAHQWAEARWLKNTALENDLICATLSAALLIKLYKAWKILLKIKLILNQTIIGII